MHWGGGGGGSILVTKFRVCAYPQQKLHEMVFLLVSGEIQGCSSIVILTVNLEVQFDENSKKRRVSAVGHIVEQRRPSFTCDLDIEPLLD